jgi:hypothetical protein
VEPPRQTPTMKFGLKPLRFIFTDLHDVLGLLL